MGLLTDLIPNSPNLNIMRVIWQTVRRITSEILVSQDQSQFPFSLLHFMTFTIIKEW